MPRRRPPALPPAIDVQTRERELRSTVHLYIRMYADELPASGGLAVAALDAMTVDELRTLAARCGALDVADVRSSLDGLADLTRMSH